MKSRNRAWKLLADKLANEATEQELQELDQLLLNNSEMRESARLLSDWWHNESESGQGNDSQAFDALRQRLKDLDF